jgi:hypothetical protein
MMSVKWSSYHYSKHHLIATLPIISSLHYLSSYHSSNLLHLITSIIFLYQFTVHYNTWPSVSYLSLRFQSFGPDAYISHFISDESNGNSLGLSSSVTVPFELEIYLILDISNVSYDRAFLLEQLSPRTTIDRIPPFRPYWPYLRRI